MEYDPDRPDNLYDPVSGDPGAHDPFDAEAIPVSRQLQFAKHRREVGVLAALLIALVATLLGGPGGDGGSPTDADESSRNGSAE